MAAADEINASPDNEYAKTAEALSRAVVSKVNKCLEPETTVLMIGDNIIASHDLLEEINESRYRQLQYKDLNPSMVIYGPCVIWNTPKGTVFMTQCNKCITLSLHETLMLRIGALTLDALEKKYSDEPQRG